MYICILVSSYRAGGGAGDASGRGLPPGIGGKRQEASLRLMYSYIHIYM